MSIPASGTTGTLNSSNGQLNGNRFANSLDSIKKNWSSTNKQRNAYSETLEKAINAQSKHLSSKDNQ